MAKKTITNGMSMQTVRTNINDNFTELYDAVGAIPTVNDTLTSSSTTEALSAKQGKILKDELDTHKADDTKHITSTERTIWNNKLDASAYTAADVLAKVKTVDGDGSGLDADLLDGAHAGNGPNNVLKLDSGGFVPLPNIPGTLTGKSADMVDGKHFSDIQNDAQAKVDTHASLKQTHGISSGYYIAKTSRSDQLPDWNDIQGKPDLSLASDLDTHKAETASTSQKGHVQLSTSTTSTSTSLAATASAVKTVNDALTSHEAAAAPHSGHETPAGAQAKADAAETNAKNYASGLVGSLANLLTTAKSNSVAAINEIFGKVEDVEDELDTHQHSKTDISDFPTLATVATSGKYSDLSGKPSIPTVNDTLTSTSATEALSAKQGKALNDSITSISNQLGEAIMNTPPIDVGMNTVTHTGKTSTFPKISFKGRHYINLLGKDGDCEDTSKFGKYRVTVDLDSENKLYGNNCYKLTSTGSGACITFSIDTYGASTGKYYLFSAYVKNVNLTEGIRVRRQWDVSTATYSETVYKRLAVKLYHTTPDQTHGIYIYGDAGQYAYVDGIMVNEITEDEYNNLTIDQLLAKYPYVNSYGALINPHFTNDRGNGDIQRFVVEGQFTDDDEVQIKDGKVSGLLWWKHKALFGKDYNWQFNYDLEGFKRMQLPGAKAVLGEGGSVWEGIKYDGKVLTPLDAYMAPDRVFWNTTVDVLYISASDTDTGWAETITPNADEIKAFMNGWKATANDGTRYTAWVSVVDGTTLPTTQTIDFVKANIAPNYKGYHLHYKLANPEVITIENTPIAGNVWSLVPGDNYIEIGSNAQLSENSKVIINSYSTDVFGELSLEYAQDVYSAISSIATTVEGLASAIDILEVMFGGIG